MFIKIIAIILLVSNLYSAQLQRNYFVKGDEIKLSAIIKDLPPKKDTVLFTLSNTKHIKRIKAKELIKILKEHGYKGISSPYPYIQFNKISPIDTTKIQNFLIKHYKAKYKEIEIKNIIVSPRSYRDSMPKEYSVEIRSKEHLGKDGVVAIKTDKNKKIFFNYSLKAFVRVFTLKTDLERNGELSQLNTLKNSIILDKFRAMPLQTVKNSTLELKRKMKKGEIITVRDVAPLSLVRRDSSVNVSLYNGSIVITFSARALQDGAKGDTIFVENDKGKKIRVLVTGKNKAKVK